MARYTRDADIHIAVIEQNPVEREYLLALVAGAPGVTLSGAYSGLPEALPEFEKDPPDMVIADLEGSNDLAVTCLKQLHTALPHTSVLVLSTERNRDHLFEALEAGVSGWLQKPCTADQILRAIIVLHEGGAILSSPVARKILDYFHARGSSVDCSQPPRARDSGFVGPGRAGRRHCRKAWPQPLHRPHPRPKYAAETQSQLAHRSRGQIPEPARVNWGDLSRNNPVQPQMDTDKHR